MKIDPPIRGVADKAPYIDAPNEFAPPEGMRNVWAFDAGSDRARLGQRPGWTTRFPTQICRGQPIQYLFSASQASTVTGYRLGECMPLTMWESRVSGTLTGHAWMLSSSLAMARDFYDDRGGGTASAYHCSWAPWLNTSTTPNHRECAFTAIWTDPAWNGNVITTGLRMVNELGQLVWQTAIEDREASGVLGPSPRRIFANQIAWSPGANRDNMLLLVAVETQTTTSPTLIQGYLYVFNGTNGTYLKRYALNNWAQDVNGVTVRPDGKVAVVFFGSGTPVPTSLPNQVGPAAVVEPGGTSSHFQSGVMLFARNPSSAEPLLQEQFGTPLPSSHPFFSTAHGYFRFSEKLARSPRGCYPTAIAATPSNGLLVTFSNKGWGYQFAIQPRDDVAAYTTAALLDSAGNLLWEVDTQSIRRAYTGSWGTYVNDIPDSGNPFDSRPPSLSACAVGPQGELYVGGARNSPSTDATQGWNVFRLRPSDGAILWRASIGGAAAAYSSGVAQAGMVVDPTDGNLLVVGRRNDEWGNASQPRQAHLWKLSGATGVIIADYDLSDSDAAIAYGVSVDPLGRIFYTTDRIIP
ncbi:MAG: hypothetical protein SFZ23_08645 [Planctomycetota bacterium]|nr:hypothetical protein [Planctomycetota bacterium]